MRKTTKKMLSTLLVAGMCVSSLSGCAKSDSNNTSNEVTPTAEATKGADANAEATATPEPVEAFSESPELATMVTAGTIPTVENRLPDKDDVMVENVESVGTYGGAYQFAFTKAGWATGKPIEQGLFRFRNDGTVEPNVAKGYDVNEDATVYTIYLRKGMKWSDGEPFTADDCVFFYDHMCVPETFGKSLWDCFKVDNPETGEQTTAKFDKVDDYTFTVTFQFTKPAFIENLAINGKWCFAPAHYHKTILPEFIGQEAAEAKAKEMGFADVAAMGKETGYYFWNVPGVPTLNPYVLSTESGKNDTNSDYYEFVRNPYYWKVDTKGQQLPYVEKMEVSKISDESQTLIKVLGGEITAHIGLDWKDVETLKENEDKGGYNLLQWGGSGWGDIASQLELNQTAKDEDLRKLFQTKEFRQALSISVDREEYGKLLADGWSTPKQACPGPDSFGYSETWEKKWAEYDPATAKSLLEGLGLKMGSDGFYDFGDGKDLVLNISAFTGSGADNSYVLLKKYYDAIGIKTVYQPVDRDLLSNRVTTNDFDCVLGPIAPAETINIALRPDTIVPVRNYAEWYGQVGNWYASNGKEGIAPTGDLLELCNLYDKLKATLDPKEREQVALQMYKLHEDNIWIIGYMSSPSVLSICSKKLKNFPVSAIYCDEFRGIGIAHLDSCWFEQ